MKAITTSYILDKLRTHNLRQFKRLINKLHTAEMIQKFSSVVEIDGKHFVALAFVSFKKYDKKNQGKTVYCPFCGNQHNHGTSEGHRIAHCDSNDSYDTIEINGYKLNRDDGYVLYYSGSDFIKENMIKTIKSQIDESCNI